MIVGKKRKVPKTLDNRKQKVCRETAKIVIKEGDLLDVSAKYTMIVQQNNCITTIVRHLSADIARAYPYADPYSRRRGKRNRAIKEDRPEPGSILVLSDASKTTNRPHVACLFAQRSFGTVNSSNDTKSQRQAWFRSCLVALTSWCNSHLLSEKTSAPITIAFPCRIGCGAAGGHWPTYLDMIQSWATTLPPTFTILILGKK